MNMSTLLHPGQFFYGGLIKIRIHIINYVIPADKSVEIGV